MFKLRSVLIAVALVALLSITSWQASFAKVGDGKLNVQADQIRSNAPAAEMVRCELPNYVYDPNLAKCICPEGRYIDFFGNCKKIQEDAPPKPDKEPVCGCQLNDTKQPCCD